MKRITIILNILAPPLSIARKKGITSDVGVNILLTLLFIIPGILHAFYINSPARYY